MIAYVKGTHSVVYSRLECSFENCRLHAPHVETLEERREQEQRLEALYEHVEFLNSEFDENRCVVVSPRTLWPDRFICDCCGAAFQTSKPQDPEKDIGFGTCLSCHPRIAASWAKYGFPEGSSSTSRVTDLASAQARLDRYA